MLEERIMIENQSSKQTNKQSKTNQTKTKQIRNRLKLEKTNKRVEQPAKFLEGKDVEQLMVKPR